MGRKSDMGLHFLTVRLHILGVLLHGKTKLFNSRTITGKNLGSDHSGF